MSTYRDIQKVNESSNTKLFDCMQEQTLLSNMYIFDGREKGLRCFLSRVKWECGCECGVCLGVMTVLHMVGGRQLNEFSCAHILKNSFLPLHFNDHSLNM